MSIEFKALTEPFEPKCVLWRVGRAGLTNDGKPWAMVLAYVDARAIQERLDQVCGPENWKVEYQPVGKAFLCGLSIKCGVEWVTKWDGSDETDIEAFKGGISKSLVRAASVWGIGRYLYDLPDGWATFTLETKNAYGRAEIPAKSGKWFGWHPPELPSWARPGFNPEAEKTEARIAVQQKQSRAVVKPVIRNGVSA